MNEWMKYLLFLNRKLQFALSQINEWTNEWMNKWMNEWNIFYFLTESYNLLFPRLMNERMNEWINEWMNEISSIS